MWLGCCCWWGGSDNDGDDDDDDNVDDDVAASSTSCRHVHVWGGNWEPTPSNCTDGASIYENGMGRAAGRESHQLVITQSTRFRNERHLGRMHWPFSFTSPLPPRLYCCSATHGQLDFNEPIRLIPRIEELQILQTTALIRFGYTFSRAVHVVKGKI